MAIRTYLVFKENDKEVLNTQIFGNNFYDNTFFNEVVKLAGMTRFPECGCLTKHSLDKRKYHCEHCGFETPDRDIHSAKNMILLSGYGTYRSLKTDAVSTNKLVSLLANLENVGVVVSTTNSMEAHYDYDIYQGDVL